MPDMLKDFNKPVPPEELCANGAPGKMCFMCCPAYAAIYQQRKESVTEEELGVFIFNNNNDFGDFRNNCDSIAMTILEKFEVRRKPCQ